MTERGRRTLREQMLRNQATENLYAALSGKPARELPIPPEPVKRGPRKPSTEPSESEILRAIMALLKRHLGGEQIKQGVIYVPTTLITSANVDK